MLHSQRNSWRFYNVVLAELVDRAALRRNLKETSGLSKAGSSDAGGALQVPGIDP